MTQPIVQQNGDEGRLFRGNPRSPHPTQGPIPLSYHGVYRCPVCRYGEISNLAMMDAFACNFCNHIFTANLNQNSIELADSSLPLQWYWNGRRWQGAHRADVELGWGIGLAAIAIVLLPTTLLGLAAYMFPPIPGSNLSWLPVFWTISAFFAHLTIVIWLLVEYYQFPVFVFLKAWRRRWWQQT